MALPANLNLSQFSNKLRVTGFTLHCPTPKAISRTGGGEVLQARLGPSLWQGECQLSFSPQVKTAGIRALIDLLLDPGQTFNFSPVDYYGPAADLGGVALGSASVTLSAVASNNRDLTLAGLPSGYVLSPDDLLSFTHSGGIPALHRLVVGATANGSGVATVEVWPRVRPGWAAGAAVQLKTPFLRAIMLEREPGSSARIMHSGISFNFLQSLR
ncbi:hypothetical protein [Paracoccus litorisediminis]|uniref:TIGR02217 family protein n=1 Tax=Paracoccus litorisediminis TaxID=2006130 RepID=A0A844HXC2_9RHOB|nr:hypothetical protein [Paracoccus litorisediminis]MTH62112.1 hypothetical protein [Paracoccus litorisediminis]